MSEKSLPLVDSGTALYKGHKKPVSAARAKRLHLTDGRIVYNLKNWRFGFSTAIELTGDKLYTAFYITKYITKDCSKIFGRFFWHSRNLQKPKIIIHDLDFEKVQSADYGGFKYIFERGKKMNDVLNEVISVIKTVFSSSLGCCVIGMFFLSLCLHALVFTVRLTLDVPSNNENNKENKNIIVGHIMTDDEKIQYIIDTDKDIESASERIADIYYKQMIKEK